MARTYGVTEYPNTFKRQASFPLDNSSKFNSLSEATKYAASNPIAYEGQIISVSENGKVSVYVLEISTETNINYKLSGISSSSDESNDLNNAVININNLINSKVGIWSATKNSNDSNFYLDFDILYPLEASSFIIYYTDDSCSTMTTIGKSQTLDLTKLTSDACTFTLEFIYENSPKFKLEARAIYKNNTVIFGSLYLVEIY